MILARPWRHVFKIIIKKKRIGDHAIPSRASASGTGKEMSVVWVGKLKPGNVISMDCCFLAVSLLSEEGCGKFKGKKAVV